MRISLRVLAKFLSLTPLLFWSQMLSSAPEELGDLIEHPFRVQETLTLKLDGSPEASGIEFFVQTVNEVVFLGLDQWRVRREFPYPRSVFEFRKNGTQISSINTANRHVPSPIPLTEEVWTEVVLSPLKLAQQWSLSRGDETLTSFLRRMRALKEPLKNVENDQISATLITPSQEGQEEVLRIVSSGKILHDDKTRVNIESVWELRTRSPLTIEDLDKSLLRSAISTAKK